MHSTESSRLVDGSPDRACVKLMAIETENYNTVAQQTAGVAKTKNGIKESDEEHPSDEHELNTSREDDAELEEGEIEDDEVASNSAADVKSESAPNDTEDGAKLADLAQSSDKPKEKNKHRKKRKRKEERMGKDTKKRRYVDHDNVEDYDGAKPYYAGHETWSMYDDDPYGDPYEMDKPMGDSAAPYSSPYMEQGGASYEEDKESVNSADRVLSYAGSSGPGAAGIAGIGDKSKKKRRGPRLRKENRYPLGMKEDGKKPKEESLMSLVGEDEPMDVGVVLEKGRAQQLKSKKLSTKKAQKREIYLAKQRDREAKDRMRSERIRDKSKQPCKFYMNGACNKGDKCPFSHDGTPPKKREICKFYLNSVCTKGDRCLYMHSEYPCKFFHTSGKCNQGESCKFSHIPLTEETRYLLDKVIEEDRRQGNGGNEGPPLTKKPSLLGSPPRHLMDPNDQGPPPPPMMGGSSPQKNNIRPALLGDAPPPPKPPPRPALLPTPIGPPLMPPHQARLPPPMQPYPHAIRRPLLPTQSPFGQPHLNQSPFGPPHPSQSPFGPPHPFGMPPPVRQPMMGQNMGTDQNLIMELAKQVVDAVTQASQQKEQPKDMDYRMERPMDHGPPKQMGHGMDDERKAEMANTQAREIFMRLQQGKFNDMPGRPGMPGMPGMRGPDMSGMREDQRNPGEAPSWYSSDEEPDAKAKMNEGPKTALDVMRMLTDMRSQAGPPTGGQRPSPQSAAPASGVDPRRDPRLRPPTTPEVIARPAAPAPAPAARDPRLARASTDTESPASPIELRPATTTTTSTTTTDTSTPFKLHAIEVMYYCPRRIPPDVNELDPRVVRYREKFDKLDEERGVAQSQLKRSTSTETRKPTFAAPTATKPDPRPKRAAAQQQHHDHSGADAAENSDQSISYSSPLARGDLSSKPKLSFEAYRQRNAAKAPAPPSPNASSAAMTHADGDAPAADAAPPASNSEEDDDDDDENQLVIDLGQGDADNQQEEGRSEMSLKDMFKTMNPTASPFC